MKFNLTAADWDKIARDERLRLYMKDFGVKFKFCEIVKEFEVDDSDNLYEPVSVEVEFHQLDSLMKFIYDVGECIISPGSIKIYNDYIE